MIYFEQDGSRLLLNYQPEMNQTDWLDHKLQERGEVTLRRTFTFTNEDLVSRENDEDYGVRTFVLGSIDGSYNRISKDVLGLKYDALIDRVIPLDTRIFVAHRDISIFRKIDALVDEQIVIGGDAEEAVPTSEFYHLMKTFPTSTELNHYANSRISRILKDYLGTISDAEGKLNRYLERKRTVSEAHRSSPLANLELQKFEYIRDELISMLKTADSFSEKDWQTKIIDFLLLIFPKYIAVLENVHIKDFYSKPGKITKRYIDLMLVDANGSTDIIELKKPFPNALLSHHKYRDSHTPKKELAGAIMQAEKYIFHLSKWGSVGEKEIYMKRKGELPDDLELKVTNPKALILLGRDDDFSGEQRFDFEIIRRKYANMLDIMTYDDLLRRLDNIIIMMKRKTSEEV